MSYSNTAGHLSVLRGDPILTDIDWEAGHVEPSQTIEDLVTKPNLLHNMNTHDNSHYELYMLLGSLPLHTDFPLWKDTRTLGLIVEADEGSYLTSGPSRIALQPGDVYRIDPNKRHGVFTPGFFVFIARDYPAGKEPEPTQFKTQASAWLREYLDAVKCPYRVCDQT